MTSEERTLAIDEWKEAQLIVKHQEEIIYRIRGWAIALLTALSVAVLKEGPVLISTASYVLLSCALVILFYGLEMYLRVPLHRAIKRTRQIEAALRDEQEYDGLRLSGLLGQGSDLADMREFCFRGRLLSPYVVLFMVVLVIALATADKRVGRKGNSNAQAEREDIVMRDEPHGQKDLPILPN